MDDKILEILMDLKGGQNRIETRLDKLESRFDNLESKVDTISKDFNSVKEHQAEKEIFGIKRKLEVIR